MKFETVVNYISLVSKILLSNVLSLTNKANSAVSGKHIIFTFVDHFEPGKNTGRVSNWIDLYKKQVSQFTDSDGCHPLHSWFYPCEQLQPDDLLLLSQAAYEGYGEIELHLHHANDTSESLRKIFDTAVHEYGRVGAFVTCGTPAPRYGFIHGNWSLDNSRACDGINYCGVNDELKILAESGCYADFTFPSTEAHSQPAKINSIYYAIDNPDKPKSYNWGKDACSWEKRSGDLLLVQGPLSLDWNRRKWGILPYIEDSDIASYNPPSKSRAQLWLKTGIHVLGCTDWIFVKVHTHGAHKVHMPAVLGSEMANVYKYLVEQFVNQDNSLHFATAREAFNIIKAAEDGKSGSPGQYRDYVIRKPLNRILCCSCQYDIVEHHDKNISISPAKVECTISINSPHNITFSGKIRLLAIESDCSGIPASFSINVEDNIIVIDGNAHNIIEPYHVYIIGISVRIMQVNK